MEPRVAIHVEDADVGVPADHAPQVQPLSGPLKPLGFVPLGGLQALNVSGVGVRGDGTSIITR